MTLLLLHAHLTPQRAIALAIVAVCWIWLGSKVIRTVREVRETFRRASNPRPGYLPIRPRRRR